MDLSVFVSVCLFSATLFAYVSLLLDPYLPGVAGKLVFRWFFENKLENGLFHVQKCIEMYGNVWNCTEVYGKGGKRFELTVCF
jgi:hypothetical protein